MQSEKELIYRGKSISKADIQFINRLLSEHPTDCRSEISRKLCRAWNWVQANGFLRDMVCRSLLVLLEKSGYITLPARRGLPPQLRQKTNQTPPRNLAINTTPFYSKVKNLDRLDIIQVRRTPTEKDFNDLIEKFHYLGYTQPVGEHLKYIVYHRKNPISCFAFSSAPRHIGPRDRYIGWTQDTRRRNINLIAYNTRFLICPWVHVPNLASHLLSRISHQLSDDWHLVYKHPIHLLETFVDTQRFTGSCYKAANWKYVGLTTGRGKNDQTHKANRSLKAIFVYPLTNDFRERLQYVS